MSQAAIQFSHCMLEETPFFWHTELGHSVTWLFTRLLLHWKKCHVAIREDEIEEHLSKRTEAFLWYCNVWPFWLYIKNRQNELRLSKFHIHVLSILKNKSVEYILDMHLVPNWWHRIHTKHTTSSKFSYLMYSNEVVVPLWKIVKTFGPEFSYCDTNFPWNRLKMSHLIIYTHYCVWQKLRQKQQLL